MSSEQKETLEVTAEAISKYYSAALHVGFNAGIVKAKQIIRHKISVTLEPTVQQALEEILIAINQEEKSD